MHDLLFLQLPPALNQGMLLLSDKLESTGVWLKDMFSMVMGAGAIASFFGMSIKILYGLSMGEVNRRK